MKHAARTKAETYSGRTTDVATLKQWLGLSDLCQARDQTSEIGSQPPAIRNSDFAIPISSYLFPVLCSKLFAPCFLGLRLSDL